MKAVSVIAVLMLTVSAFAVDIPSSSSVGPAPGFDGDGLNGRYWQRPPGSIVQEDNTLKNNAWPIIASEPPTGTFLSTTMSYTGDDLTPIGDWLGADAASLVGADPAVNNMDDGLFSFTGYIAVDAPTTLDFYLPSDDGSVLQIGGEIVVDNDGGHGAPGPSPGGSATFSEAGLYPVEITYFNGDWTDPANPDAHGGANINWHLGTTDGAPHVPTSMLHTVPEPAAVVLVIFGGLAMMLGIRRRR